MSNKSDEKQYGETLNLPQTDFPMRGNLPKKEPDILKYWQDIDLYKLVQEHNKGHQQFILHDGPPYANGDIHLGHTMNKVLKDMIVKSKTLQGYDAPYVPGWDTHGLPIELKAIASVGLDAQSDDVVGFRDACKAYADKYVAIQSESFQRLGVRGDWANPYLTYKPEFEAKEIGVFGEMAKKGYIYKGVKPVYWCPHDHTALAEAEIEYGEEKSPSIYVRFAVKDAKGKFDKENTYFIIWTTTPWTLPANEAICLNPEFVYRIYNFGDVRYIMGKDLAENAIKEMGLGQYTVDAEFLGKDLEYVEAQHPFVDRTSLVILGSHVTTDAGTGCVHTAPGHGTDDYYVGQKYHLPNLSPVDENGYMTEEAGPFAGLSLDEANKAICKYMEENGSLLKFGFIKHQYPHCWRCGTPTIFRATPQWFASVDGFRKEALNEIENNISFTPEWGKERIYNMVRDRGDWCISRQRTWGVPIPVMYCQDCGEIILDDDTIKSIQAHVAEKGTNCWYTMEPQELLPQGYKCPKCGGTHFRKETDIMDVWFDSGSSHVGVLQTRPELSWPADLYLEGSDQHRGWFNSSLSTSVACFGKAPYKSVLTHGFTVDEKGNKMSKSKGNGVDPKDVIKQRGADVLRMWVASADYRGDVSVGETILKQVGDAYRKIRNTFRFMLGSISDFDPVKDRVAYEEMPELDQWIMQRFADLVARAKESYNDYEFHVIYRSVYNFCTLDLSAVYFSIIKDRLYSEKADSKLRRSAQTVLYDMCLDLDIILSPIISFTAEEVFQYIKLENKPLSVQLMDWPDLQLPAMPKDKKDKWDHLMALRDVVAKPLETERKEKRIGNSLDAQVTLYLDESLDYLKKDMENLDMDLADLFIVSHVHVEDAAQAPADAWKDETYPGLSVTVRPASGHKCARCWKYTEDVGSDPAHPDVCGRCAKVLAD
jgi:isoleucyl-tRNA synthetase